MQQQMEERLYDQLVAWLAGKGRVREDASAGVLVLSELHGTALDPPMRLRLTPETLSEHLEKAAPESTSALEQAWWRFTEQIGEAVDAAGPGETELVLTPAGVASQRPA